MPTCSVPESLVIGRIVVFTSNHFLARAVEELIRRERRVERSTAGTISMNGESVHWVALPRAATRTTLAERAQPLCW